MNVVTAEEPNKVRSEDSASVGKGCAVLDRPYQVLTRVFCQEPTTILTPNVLYSTTSDYPFNLHINKILVPMS